MELNIVSFNLILTLITVAWIVLIMFLYKKNKFKLLFVVFILGFSIRLFNVMNIDGTKMNEVRDSYIHRHKVEPLAERVVSEDKGFLEVLEEARIDNKKDEEEVKR